MIFDKETGKTKNIINYQTGLPDDEIYSMAKDSENGLWLSHSKGISRVDFNFPVKNYSTYPGLEGNINSIIGNFPDVYVATSEGLFYLSEVKEYEVKEVLRLIKNKSKQKRISDEKNKTQTENKRAPRKKEKVKKRDIEREKNRAIIGIITNIFSTEKEEKEKSSRREKITSAPEYIKEKVYVKKWT